ncbi:hypothetical protein WJX73_004955 [Symbiochloris irregularis]|uniref:F-box domain-containing protein n=1 Tax=Symbiochloris irregularis TaxID=706552 RepID=A0AAW1PQR8_9CHLO
MGFTLSQRNSHQRLVDPRRLNSRPVTFSCQGCSMPASLDSAELQDVAVIYLLPRLSVRTLGSLACCCRTLRALVQDRHEIWRAAAADSLWPQEAAVLIPLSAAQTDVQGWNFAIHPQITF